MPRNAPSWWRVVVVQLVFVVVQSATQAQGKKHHKNHHTPLSSTGNGFSNASQAYTGLCTNTTTTTMTKRELVSWSPVVNAESFQTPKFVVILSTQRGASTETAEAFGRHPCAVSFNEMVQSVRFPGGYSGEYVEGTAVPAHKSGKKGWNFDDFIGRRFKPTNVSVEALRGRAKFCDARPPAVRQFCGDACVVALKVHFNVYPSKIPLPMRLDPQQFDTWSANDSDAFPYAEQASWAEFLTREDVLAVALRRNLTQAWCSLMWSEQLHDFGHSPSAHTTQRPPCVVNASNEASKHQFVETAGGQYVAMSSSSLCKRCAQPCNARTPARAHTPTHTRARTNSQRVVLEYILLLASRTNSQRVVLEYVLLLA